MSSKLYEKLKQYKNFANDCIHFKFIFNQNDLKNHDENSDQESMVFRPEFTHQIFGDDEEIFGYKNLRIDYFLTPGYLDAYIGLSCKEKVSSKRFDGIEPDDVYSAFIKFGCSPHFTRNLDVFCSEKLKADKEFKPFGQKIYEYSREADRQNKYEIFKIDSSLEEYSSQKFIDYILNVQTMLIYYIETASFIDTDDPQWTFFLLYENRKIGSDQRYVTIGFLSVYNYYAYPDKTRSRVSQVLILPNFQKSGHGAELLQAVYRDACENSKIIDVTAESPSPEFINLRDYVTTKMCANLSLFTDKAKLKAGFTKEMAQDALNKYKIPKLQSRRSYEILRLSITNEHNQEEWRDFRLDIKKRFYLPFIRKNKYARNGGSLPDTRPEEAEGIKNQFESTTIGFGDKKAISNGKFETMNSRLFSSDGEGKSSFGFDAPSETVKSNGFKSVSFKASNVTAGPSGDENDDENQNDENKINPNLFVSETERKKYLEDQFQELTKDYFKIVERLESENILPF